MRLRARDNGGVACRDQQVAAPKVETLCRLCGNKKRRGVGDLIEVQFNAVLAQEAYEEAALKGGVGIGETFTINCAIRRDACLAQSIRSIVEEVIFDTLHFGNANKGVVNTGIVSLAQIRQELVSDAIPGEIEGFVRGVQAVRQLPGVEVGDDFFSRYFAERPDDLEAAACGDGENSAKSAGRSAAENAHENGFGLVAAVVARREDAESAVRGDAREKLVADTPRKHFEGLGRIGSDDFDGLGGFVKRETEVLTKFTDKIRVSVACAGTGLVVEVRYLAGMTHFEQHVEHTDGIGTSGHGDEEWLMPAEHVVCGDGGADALGEISRERRHETRLPAWKKSKVGSGAGTRTPDTRIMIPLL